jgi:hypothetical protein
VRADNGDVARQGFTLEDVVTESGIQLVPTRNGGVLGGDRLVAEGLQLQGLNEGGDAQRGLGALVGLSRKVELLFDRLAVGGCLTAPLEVVDVVAESLQFQSLNEGGDPQRGLGRPRARG